MNKFNFHFENIKFSKSQPYTLNFIGCCTNSNGREVSIKYTGADISNESSIIIDQNILKKLRKELIKSFGYGPFDIKASRKKLKDKGSYSIDSECND